MLDPTRGPDRPGRSAARPGPTLPWLLLTASGSGPLPHLNQILYQLNAAFWGVFFEGLEADWISWIRLPGNTSLSISFFKRKNISAFITAHRPFKRTTVEHASFHSPSLSKCAHFVSSGDSVSVSYLGLLPQMGSHALNRLCLWTPKNKLGPCWKFSRVATAFFYFTFADGLGEGFGGLSVFVISSQQLLKCCFSKEYVPYHRENKGGPRKNGSDSFRKHFMETLAPKYPTVVSKCPVGMCVR